MINVIWFSLIIPLVFITLTIFFFLKIFKKSHQGQGHTEYNDNYYEDDDERRRRDQRRRDQRRRDEEEEEKREEDEYYRR